MSNQVPTPNLPPIPDQWAGYAGPKNFGDFQYGVHKAGTAAATAGASLITTAVLAVGGYESPLVNFKNEGDPEAIEVARNTTSSHNSDELLWTSSKRVGEQDVWKQEHQVLRGSVQMYDAPNFDVLTSPGAWRPVHPEALSSLVLHIKHAQEDGWTVTSVAREGVASDEARYDQGAGLGRANGPNERLAGQYGQFAGDLFETELTRAGVDVTGARFTETSREVVLDAGQYAVFDAEARRLGYTNASEFVITSKANPAGMSAEARTLMSTFISSNRGANFAVELSRSHVEKEGVYAGTTATRCVTDYTTNITTEQRTDTDHIPVLVVPFPALKIRRRKGQEDEALLTDWIERQKTPWAKNVNTMRKERQEGFPQDDESEYVPRPPRQTAERESSADNYVSLEEMIRRSRRNARIGKVGAGLVLAGLIATLRFDTLSCPDSKLWTDTFPGISAGFEIPFIDVQTPKVMILDPYCRVGQGNGGDISGPTCDTRHSVYQDGHLIHEEETNHQGAITVTEGLPK